MLIPIRVTAIVKLTDLLLGFLPAISALHDFI